MPTIEVIRGSATFTAGSATSTITEGTDYNLPVGATVNTCYIRVTNPRYTGQGNNSAGGSQNLDDFTASIQNPGNILTSITFERDGTANTNRVEYEIKCYVGNTGGDNEWEVLDVGALTFTGTTVEDGATLVGVSPDKLLIEVTSQRSSNTARTLWQTALCTINRVVSGSDVIPRVQRGSTNSNCNMSYAAIRYTGSNWRNVQRLNFTSSETGSAIWALGSDTVANDFNITTIGGGVALLDASRAFIHCQYRIISEGTQGLDDCGENIEIVNTTTFRLRKRTDANSALKEHRVWVVENTQNDGTARNMVVQHFAAYDNDTTGPEPKDYNHTVTTVAALDETSLEGLCASSDGGGTAYPRGSCNLQLTSTSNVQWRVSDSGQEERRSFQVVQWPEDPASGVTLVVQAADHGHVVDTPGLTQQNVLTAQEIAHGHVADTPTLAQQNTLVVSESVHSHLIDAVSITQSNVLNISDTDHAHIADAVALIQDHLLAVQETLHSQSVDSTNLSQANSLVVSESVHGHLADNIDLTTSTALVLEDTLHSHLADALELTQSNLLTLDELSHAHIVDSLLLIQDHVLAIQESLHSHTVDNVALFQANLLVVNGIDHGHQVDEPTLSTANNLSVEGASHGHGIDNIELVQANVLVVDGASHLSSVNEVVLSSGITLVVNQTDHSHIADEANLSQASILTVDGSTHSHGVDSPTLNVAINLVVQDALHAHQVDNTEISQDHVLTVLDTLHSHLVDSTVLQGSASLLVQDMGHNHSIDSAPLIQQNVLIVDDALHQHLVDIIVLSTGASLPTQEERIFIIKAENRTLFVARSDNDRRYVVEADDLT